MGVLWRGTAGVPVRGPAPQRGAGGAIGGSSRRAWRSGQ
ncbi:hypothetical protein APASM_4789 [Actinosynnema pretiosum subsp. pretiosum]|nr:hypothetical protein APASM_4789 [Actinosynnema pretiosum subsp. pretiosum]